jgi:O-antigen ligase
VRRVALPAIIAVVVLVGGFWLMSGTDFVQKSPVLSRFTNLSWADRTIDSRLTIWQMGWQAVKERPVLGWGPENFIVIFSKYYQPKLWNQEPWFDRSHNIYLDWLINAIVFYPP